MSDDELRNAGGFGKKVANWVGSDRVDTTNVLHLATECNNKDHSAAFPVSLASWFMELFTQPGDVVLDPFLGSGPAAVAARQLSRRHVCIELLPEYCAIANERLDLFECQLDLLGFRDSGGG